jgi:hypothetical protein
MCSCAYKNSMSQPSAMAQRLLAHARICREIANATLDEATASKLENLARDCIEAARDADPEQQYEMFHRAAASARATS